MADNTVRYAYADTPLGQLHYAEVGAGHPILLLHQTPRSLDEYREVQPMLAKHHRAIAMDMYGFGMSAKPQAKQQTIEQYATGVLALADALGLERFAVMGHHTGMFVASEVAASAPGRVTAVVLSAGEYADAEFRESASRETGQRGTNEGGSDVDVDVAEIQEDGSHLTTLWAKRYPLYPKNRPDILNRLIRDCLAPGVDPAEGHYACARYVMEERVELVTAPVLVLAATDDPVSYPHTAKVAGAYVNAKSVEVVEIVGGLIPLMEQKATEVAEVVEAFLRRVGV
ncbi:alpha/beta fold hydrolase [Amycolatopsis lurida]